MFNFIRFVALCLMALLGVGQVFSQNTSSSDCQRLIDEAARYERSEQYDRALKKYLSAKEECDPQVSARVNTLIINVFEKIQRQKRDADEAKRKADENARLARQAEASAKTAQAKAERSAKSNQLVALSLTKQNQDPTLSLHLAAMAWQLGIDSATGLSNEAGASAVLRDVSSDPANWFYLPFEGHEGWVNCVAFSPDGNGVVTAGQDRSIRFWDLKGQALDTVWGHTQAITRLHFSSNGKWLMTTSMDSTVRIWQPDGKPLYKLQHSDMVEAVRWPRSSSNLLLTVCSDTVWTWDLETGKRLQGWAMREGREEVVVFSNTDSLMLTVGKGRVKLWTQNGQFIDSLFRGKNINQALFDPQGKYILAASATTLYRIARQRPHEVDSLECSMEIARFDVSANGEWVFWGGLYANVWYCALEDFKNPRFFSYEGGMRVNVTDPFKGMQFFAGTDPCIWRGPDTDPVLLRSTGGAVLGAAFSKDGRWLLTGDEAGTVRLWFVSSDWPTYQPDWARFTFADKEVSPDQRHILVTDRERSALYNMFDQQMTMLPIEGLGHAVFSPDGSLLMASSYADSLLYLFDSTGVLLHRYPLKNDRGTWLPNIVRAGFSPKNQALLMVTQDNHLALMQVKDGRLILLPHTHREDLMFEWSGNGQYIITHGLADSTKQLWTAEGRPVTALPCPDKRVWNTQFIGNDQRILTQDNDFCTLHDLTGRKVATIEGTLEAIAPDRKRLLMNMGRGIYQLYDTDGHFVRQLDNTEENATSTFWYSSEGRYIFCMKRGKSYFWSPEGKYLFEISGEVYNLSEREDKFSFPNGDILSMIRGENKNTLRRWDTQGRLVKIYEGFYDYPNSWEVSSDGRFVMAYNYQKAMVWENTGTVFTTYRPQNALYKATFLPTNQHLYLELSRGLPQVWPIGEAFAKRCQILDRADLIRAGVGGDVEEALRTASADDLQEIGAYFLDRADWLHARRFYERLLEVRPTRQALQALYQIGEATGQPYPLTAFYAAQQAQDLVSHADFFFQRKQWKVAHDLYTKAEPLEPSAHCLNRLCSLSDTLRLPFDMQHYHRLQGNFNELYQAGDYLHASQKNLPLARTLYEYALTVQPDAYLLEQVYTICEADNTPFDTLRFLTLTSPYGLAEAGSFFMQKRRWTLARMLYEKAERIAHSPEVVMPLLAIADSLHQPFDLNRLLDFADAYQLADIGSQFEELKQWERAMKVYQRRESLAHDASNIIALHRLAYEQKLPFDYTLMMQSQDPNELGEYASSLNAYNEGPTRDKIPFLEKAIQLEEKRLLLDSTHSKRSLATYYNNYGFCLLFLPAPKQAEAALRKALTLQPGLPVVFTNLPIALLLQSDRYDEAKALYQEYRDKPYRNGTYHKVFLADLEDLESQGITHPDFKKIEKLLGKE